MTEKKREKFDWKKLDWKFALVTWGAVILGIVGIALAVRHEHYRWSKLFDAIGEALVIAGFLALTVDRYIKHRLVEDVSHDVAKYTFGYRMPKLMEDTFWDIASGWRIYRENLVVTWTIARIEGSEMLSVVVHFSFNVKNLGTSGEKYRQSMFVEDHDQPTIEMLMCVRSIPGQADSTLYESTAANGNIVIDRSEIGLQKAFGEEIMIQPGGDGQGPTYKVSAQYSMKLPEDYSDVFAFGGPTINVTIQAKYPEDLMFVPPDAQPGSRSPWQYPKFYVPAQHLRVRWYKLPAKPAGSTQGK